LLDRIRDGPPGSLDALTDFIRRGATNQEAINAIQQLLGSKVSDDDDEIMSSPSDGTGPPTGVSDQAPGAMSIIEHATAPHGKGKERGVGSMPVSHLLATLKTCSTNQGEAMLRGFMAQKLDEKFALPPWAQVEASKWDRSGTGESAPTAAERASWRK
jgi:hypothetical protein